MNVCRDETRKTRNGTLTSSLLGISSVPGWLGHKLWFSQNWRQLLYELDWGRTAPPGWRRDAWGTTWVATEDVGRRRDLGT